MMGANACDDDDDELFDEGGGCEVERVGAIRFREVKRAGGIGILCRVVYVRGCDCLFDLLG